MMDSSKIGRKKKAAIVAIGILFITLGITLKSESSWLFTVSGVLILAQRLYIQLKHKNKNS